MTAGATAPARGPIEATLTRIDRIRWVVPLALFLAALLAFLRCIDCASLWFDEVASLRVAERGPDFFLSDRFGWMNVQTPLHYLATWLMLQLGDPAATSFWVRLPSAVAGAAIAPLVYLFGRDLLRSSIAGLVAGVLVIFAPVSVAYANDVRPYTLLAFWVTAAAYCLGRASYLAGGEAGRGRWWAGFAACTLAGAYSSYNTLTLALPALAPYLAWVVASDLLGGSRARRKNALYGVGALAAVALGSVPALLDAFRVPRTPPNLAIWSPTRIITVVPEFSRWFAALGYDGPEQRLVQPLIFLVALSGALLTLYRVIRTRRGRGDQPLSAAVPEARPMALLASLAWLPALILSVLSTTNAVYQRYAIFAMPAYFVLIGFGLACWPRAFRGETFAARSLDRTAGVVALAAALLFAVAGLFGRGPILHLDYRAAAAYLTANARSGDAAIFLGTDPSVADVYWHGRPPLETITALDPRIAAMQPKGDVYWLVGYEHAAPTSSMPPGWEYLGDYGGLSVFREPHGSEPVDILAGMEGAARRLAEAGQGDPVLAQVAPALLGSAVQSRGDPAAAASAYREAGTLYPIGGEYQATSEEYARRGEMESAWLDAVMAKSMQPERPALHRWLAALLERGGKVDLAEQERAVARFLEEAK